MSTKYDFTKIPSIVCYGNGGGVCTSKVVTVKAFFKRWRDT